ncbi:DUF3833 domain-containing protein [Shewanella sp. VB17]|uniref:DUF3833 domain-containing protein n=1 Tax=Shewanella sp. VB17 TaxID=2739432 RepID=UPI001563192B|nr:DUF3833 domain-containing protein [Shewanella sp. VB17]NRD74256.1 DUF3833 domain-containing protein [Shewanella sp. VB17]
MKYIVLSLLTLLLSACSTATLDDYEATTPELHLDHFFNGELVAYGIVFDRSGKMLRRFKADIDAQWEGKLGTISEQFVFNDGERTTRVWQLTKENDHQYIGEAGDVIGIAEGETRGSVLFWRYDMDINVDGVNYQVTLDDWMYLFDEKRLFNKTDITKFGIKVGEIILYIEKRD